MDPVRLSRPGVAARNSRPLIASAGLLALLVLFCLFTRWGHTYPTFAAKTWVVWRSGHRMSVEERRAAVYDSTYSVLLYIRDSTPPDAVILLPPISFIVEHGPSEIPLLASAGSAYGVIYPRVPVHAGTPSPSIDRVDYILVWEHWGLDLIAPGAPRTEENRIQLFPWPRGRKVP